MIDQETQPIVTFLTNPGGTTIPENYPISPSGPQSFYDQSGRIIFIRSSRNDNRLPSDQIVIHYFDGPVLSQTFPAIRCRIYPPGIPSESSNKFSDGIWDRWDLFSRRLLRKIGVFPPTKWDFRTPSIH